MALIWISKMHLPNIGVRKDAILDLLPQFQRLRRQCRKRLELPRLNPRDKLGIPKALVVSIVAQKLGSVVKERLDFGLGETSLRCSLLPVSMAVVVQGNDEVVNMLRFRTDLAEDNTSACKAGSMFN